MKHIVKDFSGADTRTGLKCLSGEFTPHSVLAACGQRVAFGFCGHKLQEEPDSFLLTLQAFWIELHALYTREWGAFIQLIPQKGNNQNLFLIWSR